MNHLWKKSLLTFVFASCIFNSDASTTGIRPNVSVSPNNAYTRENPKIKASDLDFDLKTAKVNRGMFPTLEKFANEVSILVNNLYKRRELDEVNVRSLIRIRFYLAYVYQAIQKPTATQVKLQKRIIEAVREINEELAHRLDFEERYKSGLISIPKGKSTRSFETQTEDQSVGNSNDTSFVEANSPAGKESEPPLAEGKLLTPSLSSGVITQLKAKAQKSRTAVAFRQPGSTPNISTTDALSNASARSRALVNLVKNGKIPINALSAKDQETVSSYLNKPSSEGNRSQLSASDKLEGGAPPLPQLPKVQRNAQGSLGGSDGDQVSTGGFLSREGLPARTQALLNFVESGKLSFSSLSAKDQALIGPYLAKPGAISNIRQAPVVDRLTGTPATLSGDQVSTGGSLSREGLPARTQALLNFVESGKLSFANLSAKDQALIGPYLPKPGATQNAREQGSTSR